jgi:hypothetical protein
VIRLVRLPAALAVLAVIAAGCSGTQSGTGGAADNAAAAARETAVKFAECMRGHGISAFPDPDAEGKLTIDAVANGSSGYGVEPTGLCFRQPSLAPACFERCATRTWRTGFAVPRGSMLPTSCATRPSRSCGSAVARANLDFEEAKLEQVLRPRAALAAP